VHPVEDFDLSLQAIGEGEGDGAVAHGDDLGDVGRESGHRSDSISLSVSPARNG
jgi:hypothetical protein